MENLSQWRKIQGLSQEELGKKLGLGEKWRTYSAWETGKNPFPAEIKEKLKSLGYDGPFPEPGQPGDLTREDLIRELAGAMGRLEARIEARIERAEQEIRADLEALAEILRAKK